MICRYKGGNDLEQDRMRIKQSDVSITSYIRGQFYGVRINDNMNMKNKFAASPTRKNKSSNLRPL
jgi:hypothetical protein